MVASTRQVHRGHCGARPGYHIWQHARHISLQVRCGRCGGHLGDIFRDGALFVGTAAAESGRRYCIDGGALAFRPADGSEMVYGEAPAKVSE